MTTIDSSGVVRSPGGAHIPPRSGSTPDPATHDPAEPEHVPWWWLWPRLALLPGGAAVVVFIAVLLGGCTSPTAPEDGVVVRTAVGDLVVYANGQPWDEAEIHRQTVDLAIIFAAESGRGSTPPLRGVALDLQRGRWRQGGVQVLGSYDPGSRTARISAPDLALNLIRHELGHALCYQEQLPCDCSVVDHPGGFDLGCKRLR